MAPPRPRAKPAPAVPQPSFTTQVFPSALTDQPTPDSTLQSALEQARQRGGAAVADMPVGIIAINDGTSRPVALLGADDEHYSASALKICAQYAAYELLFVLRDMSNQLGASGRAASFLDIAQRCINPIIEAKYKTIGAFNGMDRKHGLPTLHEIFVAKDGSAGVEVNFATAYRAHQGEMIVNSEDTDAMDCVHSLGYGYIGGALVEAGFFDPHSNIGLWLGSDYSSHKSGWPYFSIATQTTGDRSAGAAASVRQLLRFQWLFRERKFPRQTGSPIDMKDDLDAAAGMSWLNRASVTNFDVERCKIGLGDTNMMSECGVLVHRSTGRRLVFAWQNVLANNRNIDAVAGVFNDTLRTYLGVP